MNCEQIACDYGERDKGFLAGLNRVAADLERQVDWNENLSAAAAGVADLLESSRCLILLPGRGADFRVAGAYPAADHLPPHFLISAARQTANAARALLWDGSHCPTSPTWGAADAWNGNFLAAPIFFGEQPGGILLLDRSKEQKMFSRNDALRLETVCLVLGRAMQVSRLQSLLRSRFVQIALAGERKAMDTVGLDASKTARIVARTFYKEMSRAGFSSENIIDAATEILSQLGNRVKRYNRRRH